MADLYWGPYDVKHVYLLALVFTVAPSVAACRTGMSELMGKVFNCESDQYECFWDETGRILSDIGYVFTGDHKPSSNPISGEYVLASRGFAGPSQYPPSSFAAYGLLVFRAKASSQDRERHTMICEAYTSTFSHFSKLNVPPEQQMVTVWPIETDSIADQLNATSADDLCSLATQHYNLMYAEASINMLENTTSNKCRIASLGIGPFLLAWSPTQDISDPSIPTLCVDMSTVDTYTDALKMFSAWKEHIQDDPSLWVEPLDDENVSLKRKIELFFEENGDILSVIQ